MNPFDNETQVPLTRSDAQLMEQVFIKACEWGSNVPTDVVKMLRDLDPTAKAEVERILSTKSVMEFKVREIIDLIGEMQKMKSAIEKLEASYDVIKHKLAQRLWQQVAPQSETGKVSADVLKLMIGLKAQMET